MLVEQYHQCTHVHFDFILQVDHEGLELGCSYHRIRASFVNELEQGSINPNGQHQCVMFHFTFIFNLPLFTLGYECDSVSISDLETHFVLADRILE